METWQSGFVDSVDCRLFYRMRGSGPAIVLLHGYTDASDCWQLYAAALAQTNTVVAYDARAHGRSSNPGKDYANQANARDLRAVVTGLGLQGPIAIGHSMGARTALAAAGYYPGLLRAVVLEDPPLFDYMEPPRVPGEPLPPHIAWMAELKTQSTAELIARCLRENPTWQAGEILPWVHAKEQFATERVPDGPELMVPWRTEVAALSCPALLIAADSNCGGAVDAATAAECRALNPRIEVALVRGAGHSIRREAPARYAALVGEYLHRLGTSGI